MFTTVRGMNTSFMPRRFRIRGAMMRIHFQLTITLILANVSFRSTFGEDIAPAELKPAVQPKASEPDPAVIKERELEKFREERLRPRQGVVVEELDVNAVQPARRVGRVIRPANAVGMNEALVQRNLARIRPIMASELRLARLICEDLTVEQRTKIREELDVQMKELAKTPQPQRVGNGGLTPVPASSVRNVVASLIKRETSAECATRYLEEVDHRIAQRKQASIKTVVSRIDAVLFLSTEQCDAISAAIKSNWQEDWETWFTYPPDTFPQPLDHVVIPHLTEPQAEIWMLQSKGSFERNDRVINFNEDGWWGADPEPEKQEEQPVRVRIIRRAL